MVKVDPSKNEQLLAGIFDSTYSKLFLTVVGYSHNNILLNKFLAFLEVFFEAAS
jgi:hypothetical protein